MERRQSAGPQLVPPARRYTGLPAIGGAAPDDTAPAFTIERERDLGNSREHRDRFRARRRSRRIAMSGMSTIAVKCFDRGERDRADQDVVASAFISNPFHSVTWNACTNCMTPASISSQPNTTTEAIVAVVL